jgi:hypothetical protein
MQIIKETEKGLLLEKNCVRFWISKKWLSGRNGPAQNWKLSPAGMRAYAIAANEHRKYFGFDAAKVFEKVMETKKAVLLRCSVVLSCGGEERAAEFWLPKSMTANVGFVKKKLGEVLEGFPFEGAGIKGFAA